MNKRVTEDIVLDIGKDDRFIGIEIMDASQYVNLESLFQSNILQKLSSRTMDLGNSDLTEQHDHHL